MQLSRCVAVSGSDTVARTVAIVEWHKSLKDLGLCHRWEGMSAAGAKMSQRKTEQEMK